MIRIQQIIYWYFRKMQQPFGGQKFEKNLTQTV